MFDKLRACEEEPNKTMMKEFLSSKVCKVQYDYLQAYLDFYISYPNYHVARQICKEYMNYPVPAWRRMFHEIAYQLGEFDQKSSETDKVKDSTHQKDTELEKLLSIESQNNKIIVKYKNISSFKISFYKIEIEVLFSRNPFILQKEYFSEE